MADIDAISRIIECTKIHKINLTNKYTQNNNIQCARVLANRFPEVDMCVTFSAQYQYKRQAGVTRSWYAEWMHHMIDYQVDSVLLVSGSVRRRFDSIAALQVCDEYDLFSQIDVGVVYNPFLDTAAQQQENQRCIQKLRYPKVKTVYMQIGMNTDKAQQGIDFLYKNRPHLTIIPGVIAPTPTFAHRFAFRPWKGVDIPHSFLQSDMQTQFDDTQQMRAWYAKHNLEIVVTQVPFEYKCFSKWENG